MPHTFAVPSHALHDEAGREVGTLWRRTKGGFLLRLEPWFEAQETIEPGGAVPRLRVVRDE